MANIPFQTNSIINAACDSAPGNPPSEQDVNGVLAAVHGIGANDEIEAMLAIQMVATHFAATRALRRLKGSLPRCGRMAADYSNSRTIRNSPASSHEPEKSNDRALQAT